MELSVQDEINGAIKNAIKKTIETGLGGYDSPLIKIVGMVIQSHEKEIYDMLNSEFSQMMSSEELKITMKQAFNKKLANTLIDKLGGELEKTVNKLKADPATRARITLAVDKIISEHK